MFKHSTLVTLLFSIYAIEVWLFQLICSFLTAGFSYFWNQFVSFPRLIEFEVQVQDVSSVSVWVCFISFCKNHLDLSMM